MIKTGSHECREFNERVASGTAAGHGRMQMNTRLALHVEVDDWEI